MAWILTVLIAFWGLPLLTMLVVVLACLVSERMRRSAARLVGLNTHTPPPRRATNTAPPRA